MRNANKAILPIILIVFAISSRSLAQDKETVYLVFDGTVLDSCIAESYELAPKVKKFRKVQVKDHWYFFICDDQFVTDLKADTLSVAAVQNVKQVNYAYLLSQYEKLNEFTYDTFAHIYFLEEIDEGKYLRYDMHWSDVRISPVLEYY